MASGDVPATQPYGASGEADTVPATQPYGASEGAAAAPAPPPAGSDQGEAPDESDLFGEPDEQPPAAAPVTELALVAAGSPPGGAFDDEDPFGDDKDVDEKDLFGDDGDIDEKELFGSDEEAGDIDEKELFGSGDEADARPGTVAPAPGSARQEAPPPTPEPSEMDEAEIFGPLSDEEPEKVEDVILRRRPAPDEDRTFMSLKLPNILSVEKTAFNGKAFTQAVKSGYTEQIDTTGKQTVKLLNPENCIRWRFKKGPEGQMLTDEDGRPQYEANSRVVEWEDGTRSLFVGTECFNVSEIRDEVMLFEENSQDVLVCHGFVNSRLTVTPRSLKSETHEMLKSAQYNKYAPTRRSVLISQEEGEQAQQIFELQNEQRKRQIANKRAIEPGEGAEMTAAFLEGDDGGQGESVLDAKRALKAQKR